MKLSGWFIFLLCLLMIPAVLGATMSGTIRNSGSAPIPNAHVEAWLGNQLMANSTTDGSGNYVLNNLNGATSFLVRAYYYYNITPVDPDPELCWNAEYRGYLPNSLNAIPGTGRNLVLQNLPVVAYFNTGYDQYTTFRGTESVFNDGYVIRKGDVITTSPPTGGINGIGINCWDKAQGKYLLNSWGDDPGTPQDEGANPSETMNFFINNQVATVMTGDAIWDTSVKTTELSTTGSLASCELLPSYWNQSAATIGENVTISIYQVACGGQNVMVSVTEGGVVPRGPATLQPGILLLNSAAPTLFTWTSEFVDDSGSGDTNPPEYYFVATMVDTPAVTFDSATINQYLFVGSDTTSPIISGLTETIVGNTATVAWTTNEPTRTTLDYGPSAGYGLQFTNSSYSLTHQVSIGNLDLNSTLYYRITSTDAFSNLQNYASNIFIPSTQVLSVYNGLGGYQGITDTYIINTTDSDLGGALLLDVGIRNNGRRIILLKFDTSFIPQNAIITAANFSLLGFYASPGASAVNMTVTAYPLLKNWNAGVGTTTGVPATLGTANWNYSIYATNPWTTPGTLSGADRGGSIFSTEFSRTNINNVHTFNLPTALVQGWIDNPSNNYGIELEGWSPPASTSYWFRSSEWGVLTQRPTFNVAFQGVVSANCPVPPYQPLDEPTCGCIDTGELAQAISTWYSDSISINQLMMYIKTWKSCSTP